VVTPEPATLPDLATWYLTTNLPAPSDRSERELESDLAPASVDEVVRLYGLRMWVQQSYKQVKHALGWSDYQLRSDLAIRRHWHPPPLAIGVLRLFILLVGIWALANPGASRNGERSYYRRIGGKGKKESLGVLARDLEGGKGVAGALGNAHAILEGILRDAPAAGALRALLEWVFSGRGLYLYVH
jgi:hypothetical protein